MRMWYFLNIFLFAALYSLSAQNPPQKISQIYFEANGHYEKEEYSKALKLYQQYNQDLLKEKKKKNPLLVISLHSLGDTYLALGELDKARETLFLALDKQVEIAGGRNLSVFNIFRSLARLFRKQKKYSTAEEIYDEIKKRLVSLPGNKLDVLLTIEEERAQLEVERKNFSSALDIRKNNYLQAKEYYGEASLASFLAAQNLAQSYRYSKKFISAEKICLSSLNLAQEILPPDHLVRLNIAYQYAQACFDQSKYFMALSEFQRIAQVSQKAYGPLYSLSALTISGQALSYQKLGLHKEATTLYKSWLSRANKKEEKNHSQIINISMELACAYYEKGLYSKSLLLYDKFIPLCEKILGEEHKHTLQGKNNLVAIYLAQGEREKASEQLERMWTSYGKEDSFKKSKKDKKDDQSPEKEMLILWQNMATFYSQLGNFSASLNLRSKILEEQEKAEDEQNLEIIQTMIEQALLWKKQKEYPQAESLLRKAVEKLQKSLGVQNEQTIFAKIELAQVYSEEGKLVLGEKVLQDILKEIPPEQKSLLFVYNALAINQYRQKKYPEAFLFWQRAFASKGTLKTFVSSENELRNQRVYLEQESFAQNCALTFFLQEKNEKAKKEVLRLAIQSKETIFQLLSPSLYDNFWETKNPRFQIDLLPTRLGTQSVLVEFLFFQEVDWETLQYQKEKLIAIVVDPAQKEKISILDLGEAKKMESQVLAYRKTLLSQGKHQEIGQEIYKTLWAPLLSFLPFPQGEKKIYLVPDGVLHLLPFSALVNNKGDYLAKDTFLIPLSSSYDLFFPRKAEKTKNALFLAYPNIDPTISITKEGKKGKRENKGKIENLAQVFRKQNFKVKVFTEKEAHFLSLQKSDSPSILQIIAPSYSLFRSSEKNMKGIFPQRNDFNPLYCSGFIFSSPEIKKERGFLGELLSLGQVSSFPLSKTNLAVILPLKSKVHFTFQAEEVYQQQRVFRLAGAKMVLSSLWPNPSQVSEKFMDQFYQNYFKRKPFREAFRETQKAFMKHPRYSHPYYWSCYTLLGNSFLKEPLSEKKNFLISHLPFQQILQKIEAFSLKQDWKNAIAYSRVAIEKEPQNEELYQKLAWFLLQQKQFHQAEEAFLQAHRLAPSYITIFRLAHTYLLQGKITPAKKLYLQALKQAPEIHFQIHLEDFESILKLDSTSYAPPIKIWFKKQFSAQYPDKVEFDKSYELGKMLQKNREFLPAVAAYQKALEAWQRLLKKYSLLPKNKMAPLYEKIAKCYREREDYSRALNFLLQAIDLTQNPSDQINYYCEAASLCLEQGNYKRGQELHKKAKKFQGEKRPLNYHANQVQLLLWQGKKEQAEEVMKNWAISKNNNLHRLLYQLGSLYPKDKRYQKALQAYLQAYEYFSREPITEAIYIKQQSSYFTQQGEFAKAKQYAHYSLKWAQEKKDLSLMSECYLGLGEIFFLLKKYNKASMYNQKAQDISLKIKETPLYFDSLRNQALINIQKKEHKKGHQLYEKIFHEWEGRGPSEKRIRYRNELAQSRYIRGNYAQSSALFEKNISSAKKLKRRDLLASNYHNLGLSLYHENQYLKAIASHKNSLQERMSLREENFYPEKKREHFLLERRSHLELARNYTKIKEFEKACFHLEKSRFPFFKGSIASPDVRKAQACLRKNQTLLFYACVEEEVIQIVMTPHFLSGKIVSLTPLIQKIEEFPRFSQKLKLRNKATPTFPSIFKNLSLENQNGKKRLEALIDFYRQTLQERNETDSSERKTLGKKLFALLWVEKTILSLLEEVVIFPDGILSTLPFETLIDSRGDYLLEKHNISYSPSLDLFRLIQERKFSPSRKPILFLGKEKFSSPKKSPLPQNFWQWEFFRDQISPTISEEPSRADAYQTLVQNFSLQNEKSNREIQKIPHIIPLARLAVGNKISESYLQKHKEQLGSYRVLHFAVPSIIIPQVPELSAIVLSRSKAFLPDGYLSTFEIEELSLQADFVNLSNVHRQNNEMYSGEGVIGLTRSFLAGGANSVSIPLWSVHDQIKTDFMISFYKKLNKGSSYQEALRESKKAFLHTKKYSSPYFWASFVFYGNGGKFIEKEDMGVGDKKPGRDFSLWHVIGLILGLGMVVFLGLSRKHP